MSKAFCREDGEHQYATCQPRGSTVHRELGSYKTEPPPPTENPCQVPWGCSDKSACRNHDCHYGKLNLARERTEDMRGVDEL